MITISEAIEQIIKSSSFLEEGIHLGIINYSGLARLIRPRIEEVTMKDVTEGAIVMSLKRMEHQFKHKSLNKKVFSSR